MDTKVCTTCGIEYPATREFFYWQKRKMGGVLQSRCKTCTKTWQAQHYQKNSDHIKTRVRNYSAENADKISQRKKERYAENPEPAKTRVKKWREDNPERKKQADKDYAQKHPEAKRAAKKRYLEHHPERRKQTCRDYNERNSYKHAIYARDWRKRNPSTARAIKHRRRARERELPATLTATQWESALEHFNGCCAVCERPPGLWHTLAADHWIPLTKGGGSTVNNIVPLCQGRNGCNNSKGNKDAQQWLIEKYGKYKASRLMKRIQSYFSSI